MGAFLVVLKLVVPFLGAMMVAQFGSERLHGGTKSKSMLSTAKLVGTIMGALSGAVLGVCSGWIINSFGQFWHNGKLVGDYWNDNAVSDFWVWFCIGAFVSFAVVNNFFQQS